MRPCTKSHANRLLPDSDLSSVPGEALRKQVQQLRHRHLQGIRGGFTILCFVVRAAGLSAFGLLSLRLQKSCRGLATGHNYFCPGFFCCVEGDDDVQDWNHHGVSVCGDVSDDDDAAEDDAAHEHADMLRCLMTTREACTQFAWCFCWFV